MWTRFPHRTCCPLLHQLPLRQVFFLQQSLSPPQAACHGRRHLNKLIQVDTIKGLRKFNQWIYWIFCTQNLTIARLCSQLKLVLSVYTIITFKKFHFIIDGMELQVKKNSSVTISRFQDPTARSCEDTLPHYKTFLQLQIKPDTGLELIFNIIFLLYACLIYGQVVHLENGAFWLVR